MNARAGLTRRAFVITVGGVLGGLALGAGLEPEARADHPRPHDALSPGVYLRIVPDGTVTITCHRVEMGQGIRSSLPAALADELGADPVHVRIEQADGDPRFGNQDTDGSRSIRDFYHVMRVAGATARTMLIAAAAARWRVPTARLTAHDHAVWDEATRRSLGFGELALAAAALPVPHENAVTLRAPGELTRIGHALPVVDAHAFVTGSAVYGADVVLPGMLTAVIERPPVVGGRVAHVDTAAALRVAGVRRVITLPDWTPPALFKPLGGVAVVADHTWAALRGRAALSVTWNDGDNAGYDSARYKRDLETAVRAPGHTVRNVGDVEHALATAHRTITAEYHVPHLSQSPMEPPAAVAHATHERCEVWAATQNPQGARDEVAHALGLRPDQVTVHVTFLGGGFGRKSKPDFVVEAALLSREMQAPVRVQWTREDEIRHGYYHAVSTQRLEAGLDASNRVVAWRHRIASPSISSTFVSAPSIAALFVSVDHLSDMELQQGITDLPLAIPNVRVETCAARAHVRIGWMRSVYNVNHAFAVQSFIAEIAAATQRDPRDVLLEVLGPARHLTPAEAGVHAIGNYGESLARHPVDVGRLRNVVQRVTDQAGWAAPRAAGRALGLAAHRSFLTYVAVVLAVSRDERHRVRVDEAWVSIDAGQIINPDRTTAQMEGAVIFALSSALRGAITAHDGAIQQTNFRDYPLLRIHEAPRAIHVDLVASDAPPGGVGEPGVPPVAPALANALFALEGTRARELPIDPLPV